MRESMELLQHGNGGNNFVIPEHLMFVEFHDSEPHIEAPVVCYLDLLLIASNHALIEVRDVIAFGFDR